jgi:hypothetical protein
VAAGPADAVRLPAALAAFHRAHPGLQVSLRHAGGGEPAALVQNGAVDVAVAAAGAAAADGVEAFALAPEELRGPPAAGRRARRGRAPPPRRPARAPARPGRAGSRCGPPSAPARPRASPRAAVRGLRPRVGALPRTQRPGASVVPVVVAALPGPRGVGALQAPPAHWTRPARPAPPATPAGGRCPRCCGGSRGTRVRASASSWRSRRPAAPTRRARARRPEQDERRHGEDAVARGGLPAGVHATWTTPGRRARWPGRRGRAPSRGRGTPGGGNGGGGQASQDPRVAAAGQVASLMAASGPSADSARRGNTPGDDPLATRGAPQWAVRRTRRRAG